MTVTNVQMIRAKVKPESVAAVDASVQDLISALEQDPPKGLRYASNKLSNGVTYLILVGLENGPENPLPTVPAYTAFVSKLPGWLAEPPSQDQMTVVGSYNLF